MNSGSAVAAQGRSIHTLFDLRNYDRRENQRGIAAAMAMADAPMPSHAGGTSYMAKTAVFRGQVGFSAALSHRFGSAPFALSAGVSHAGGKNTGANVAVAGEF